ncbi:MAG TPA: NRDE family protein [Candidatus Udaeobacter sp.]|jgi:uncharacterized protein with NRDE domain|nr:NRDE family protein [Candidatus Udaeobacter sp.]
MCTLILGIDVVVKGSILLGANRDEDPKRPSEPPALLSTDPRIAGGRDRAAGGTWLAIRAAEGDAALAVAMLNRRPGATAAGETPGASPPTRSRGLLTLDVARSPDPATAFESLVRERYAPFTLVAARPGAAWILSWDLVTARMIEPAAGWHVLTHADLDDRNEPRTAALLDSLAEVRPRDRAAAEAGLITRLSGHDPPAACLHEGPMVTVSSALVWLTASETGYRHAEGRPCVTEFQDYSALLAERAGS